MLENELLELIEKIQNQKCESNYIELKSAKEGCPKLFDTLSSFSNQQNGGIIVFGIDEKAGYAVCGVYNSEDLMNKIAEQSLQMEPVIRPLCTAVTVDGKTVVSAEIAEIDNFSKPCFYKGVGRLRGSYIRVADNDRVMTEYEVYSYEAFKKKIQDELRTVDNAVIQDIETTTFEKYMLEVRTKKTNLAKLSSDKVARLQGFTADDKPTLAGVLLFSEYPQAFFPQLCITAIRVAGTEISEIGSSDDRFIDNKRIDGTLTQMLDEAIMFVRNNMRTKTIINSTTGKRTDRTDYPVIAVRELIINALVHRDYSIHTDSAPITIRMFSDRIEIENPGGLYGRMTIDMLGKMSADTRNPSIANALEILGETENRYSGIPTVINQMKEYGLPAPKFESERGIFRATLYLEETKASANDIEEEIIKFCQTPRNRQELENHFKDIITVQYLFNKYIVPMVKAEKIKLTIPEKPKSKFQKYYS